jgi:hypothetical protein
VEKMVNFVAEAIYNNAMRKLQTDDPGHADVFNALLQQLINNDEFLMHNSGGISKLTPTGDAHGSISKCFGFSQYSRDLCICFGWYTSNEQRTIRQREYVYLL